MVGIKRGDNPSIPSNPIKGILLDRMGIGSVEMWWQNGDMGV